MASDTRDDNHPGDVLFAGLRDDQRVEIARTWDATPDEAAVIYDGMSVEHRWEVLCTLNGRTGEYDAYQARITDKADSTGAFDRIAQADDQGEGVAPDGLRLTDVGNAQRFVNLGRGRARYVHQWGRWIVYDKGRWNVDANDALVIEMAKTVSRWLMSMVSQTHGKERDQIFNAGVRAESAPALAALVRLARAIPGVIVYHEDLDADPYILNCANGTVDLRTGELRRHDPADLCTKQCPVDYDPDATAPLWAKCLNQWQPVAEVLEYLQREIGAGASGLQTETLSIHHGQGGNGKSKFFGAVKRVLADYSVEPHKSLLINSRHEQHATVVTSLFRVRLAVASETSDTDRLNDEQVKNLTGNDRLRARRMREDEWSFDPTHTLVLVSNHLRPSGAPMRPSGGG